MKEVTLSNGQTLAVESVPPFALGEVSRRIPASAPEAEEARAALAREVAWLMALPTLSVPEEWKFPRGLIHAGIQPRDGENGRILDYIEYELLRTHQDIADVQSAMYGTAITEEEISAAEATFQPDGGRESAAPDTAAQR